MFCSGSCFILYINILFLFFALAIILLSKSQFQNNGYNEVTSSKICLDVSTKGFALVVVVLYFVTLFTSVFKFGEVPYGLNVDEAGMAYDAISIVNYGVDRYLKPYPVYFINFGGGQNAMYTYLAALLIKIFGLSTAVIRIPAVLFRLSTFIATFFILKTELDEDRSDNRGKVLLFLFLFSICPYFIMQSRWGLESNLLVGFLTISICVLLYAIRNSSTMLFFISGVSFGLTLYTYALSYIIIPVFLFMTGIYLIYLKRINPHQILTFLIPLFLLAVPLLLMILVNKGFIPEIKGIITIPRLFIYRGSEISLKNILNNFYIITTVLSYDHPGVYGRELFFNAIPYFGTVYYFSVPFFALGIYSSWKRFLFSISQRQFAVNTVLTIWFWSVLVCQFLILAPNINKANAIFVPVLYFITEGIIVTVNKWKNMKPALLCIIVLYVVNFSLFCQYYFTQYNPDSKGLLWFATDYVDVVKFSKNLEKKEIQILEDITAEPYIYVLLENQVSPYHFKVNNIKIFREDFEQTYRFCPSGKLKSNILKSDQRNNGKAYVVFNNEYWHSIFKDSGYKNKDFGKMCVFYN